MTSGQQKKIWALMYELKKHDKSPNEVPLGDRLCAVIKKELHVDAIAKNPFAWLTFSQGNALIEVLKGYLKSLDRKEAASDGILDHVKIENLDEDQRKMVELVGLDGLKALSGLLAALQSIFRRQRAWNGRRGIRRFGKNLTEETIESLPRNMDLPSAG